MNRPRLRAVSLVLAAAAGLCSGLPARAQPPAPAGAPALDTAKAASRLFNAGKRAYKAGNLPEAFEAYRDAWRLNPAYDVCANLANVEFELGKLKTAGMMRAAAEQYAHCIHLFPVSDKKLAAAQATTLNRFHTARAEVAALAIEVNLTGADVLVDAQFVGKAPLDGEVYVDPGAHTVEAKLYGYEMTPQKVLAVKAAPNGNKPADPQRVALTLVPAAGPGDKVPEAEAKLGPVGAVPALPAGSASADAAAPPSPPPGPTDQPPRLNKAVLISGGTITGIAIVAGVALVVVANGKGSDADTLTATLKQPPGPPACQTFASTCSAINNDRTAHDALSNAAKGVLVGAGAVGLATLGYALLAPRPRPAMGVMVLPAIGSNQGGVVVAGSW
jgi:hypothetical protein